MAEMPLLKVEGTARKAHFERTGRYELPPIDPERIDFLRRLLRTHYLKHYRKAQTKRRAKDRIYQRDKRGNPNARVLIEEESRERLSALRSAILRHGDDKSLQQFRGREYTIVAVWEAAQYAYLEHGPDAPARAVAAAFNDMVGPDILSRHQVRSRLDHFRKFEQSPLIWKRFVEAPDNESA